MAIRVHLVGVRSTSVGVRAALSAVSEASGTSGDWTWARADVAAVATNRLDQLLDRQRAPYVRTTTEDGALWHLRMVTPDREPFEGRHWFILLQDGRCELEALEYDTVGAFAAEHGMPVELVDDPAAPLAEEVYRDLLRRHADHVERALTEHGFPHDREEILSVLTGKAVTEHELGWDVGNLPRFIECLGLGEAVEGWRESLEAADSLEEEGAAFVAALKEAPLAGLRERLTDHGVQPIEGGPVSLPLGEIVLLRDTAAQCATGFAAGLSLGAADAVSLEALEAVEHAISGVVDGRTEVLVDNWAHLSPALRDVSVVLDEAGVDTDLEVMTARLYGEGPPGAEQVFRGRVADGVFYVEGSHPPMTAATLVSALELMRQYRAETDVVVDSEEERDAVLAQVADEIWFAFGPPTIEADGLRLSVEPADHIEGVIQFLFDRRYGDTWDVRARKEFHRDELERTKGRSV